MGGAIVQKREAGRRTEAVLAFAAGALVLAASLLNLLLFHSYPLLTAEVGLAVAVILAVAALTALVYVRQPRLGKTLLAALLVFLAVDLNSDSVVAALVLGLVAAVASWKMGSELLRFLAVLAGVAMVTSALGLTERTQGVSVTRANKPPTSAEAREADGPKPPLIVHLVMDSMAGIAGLREAKAVDPQFAGSTAATLANAGFTVDSLAFSPWPNTLRAVPAAFNYDGQPDADGSIKDGGRLGKVEMLSDLRRRGYTTRLWQTSYLDFCAANPADECVTSNINHLQVLRESDLPASDRAVVIATNLAAQSSLGRRLFDGIDTAFRATGVTGSDGNFPPMIMERRHISSLHAEKTLRQLAAELRTARPGTAYMAHVLFPHYPYVYDSDCSLRRFRDWEPPWYRRPIDKRWQRYEQQYRCTLRRLMEVASAVESSPGGRDAIIIIHGDHGPRIRQTTLSEDPSIERTLFSTLFAVRRGQEPGAILDRQCSIGTLLGATIHGDRPVGRCKRQFFLEDGDDFVAQPMSDWSRPIGKAGGRF